MQKIEIDVNDPMDFMPLRQYLDIQELIEEVVDWSFANLSVSIKQFLFTEFLGELKNNRHAITLFYKDIRVDLSIYYRSNISGLDFFMEADILRGNIVVNYLKINKWDDLKGFLSKLFGNTRR